MKRITTILTSVMVSAAMLFSVTSCVNDLNVRPIDPNVDMPEDVLNSLEAYQQLLAKCYGGLSVSASEGPDSSPDISGVDGGFGQYMRALFYLNELPTDEASTCWNDQTIKSLHGLSWTNSDVFVTAMFSRLYYQIGICNEFIRRAASAADDLKGEELDYMVAQARALRALSYWHAIDMFGNVPFSTEENTVGATGPEQIMRYDLYEWLIEEISGENGFRQDLRPAASIEYGRTSQEFATMLLAKLYLNAEVYTSNDSQGRPAVSAWDECIAECRSLMQSYPSLESNYHGLFSSDNHQFTNEIIFAVQSDAENIQTYGGTNFVIKTSLVAGNKDWADSLGVDDGWGGVVVTGTFLDLFGTETDPNEHNDSRYFFTDGTDFEGEDAHSRHIVNNSDFGSGWCALKFTNRNADGSRPTSAAAWPNTDYPIFRAADAYLMLAEAQLRKGALEADGAAAFNAVRTRAGVSSISNPDLDDIIDERGREFYWENLRRQDLVRFGLLTSGEYLWDWKGGDANGRSVDERFNLFPIPANEINSNSNLVQNPGY